MEKCLLILSCKTPDCVPRERKDQSPPRNCECMWCWQKPPPPRHSNASPAPAISGRIKRICREEGRRQNETQRDKREGGRITAPGSDPVLEPLPTSSYTLLQTCNSVGYIHALMRPAFMLRQHVRLAKHFRSGFAASFSFLGPNAS